MKTPSQRLPAVHFILFSLELFQIYSRSYNTSTLISNPSRKTLLAGFTDKRENIQKYIDYIEIQSECSKHIFLRRN